MTGPARGTLYFVCFCCDFGRARFPEIGDSHVLPERPDRPSVGARCFAQKVAVTNGTVGWYATSYGEGCRMVKKPRMHSFYVGTSPSR